MLRRVLGPLTRRWAWAETAISVQERFSEVHGSSLAAVVTLSAFLSLFPLLLVTIAVVGFFSTHSNDLAGDMIRRVGLTGEAATALSNAVATAEKSRKVASAIGLAGLLWSGLGLVAAVQYAMDAVWQTGGRGLKDKLVGLAWLAGAGLILLASFAITAALNFLPGVLAPLAVVVTLAIDVALWLWSLRFLPNRDVGWKALVPGALVGAVGFEVLKVAGAVWVPRVVASSSALYGAIGVVFAVLAWLLFFGRLVVYSAVVTVVRWEEDHGTVTAQIELPRMPGDVPLRATRAGEEVRTP
ncbi:MAG TPA: YihY/virulence factor BrkB family protein [Acidimicrobiales bacterium]|nr:YihY/virulence factor BrkB family protein [Acidimicrobiales bacterium]